MGKVKAALQAQQAVATLRRQQQQQLLQTQRAEQARLAGLRQQQAQLLEGLGKEHRRLAQELRQRNRAVGRLDRLIRRAVQQTKATEKRAGARGGDEKGLTARFRKAKGRLPWPVQKGFISSRFGIRPHPVLPRVRVENLGIDFQTGAGAQAQAVCAGVVKAVAFVPGMHYVVILQHGAFHSVYARLQQVLVRKGQHVQAGAALGVVHTDGQGTTTLQLQLWHGGRKLNPAGWLRKG